MKKEYIEIQKEEVDEPWSIDQRRFYPSENQDILSGSLNDLKENHTLLTLVTAHGGLYNEVLMIGIDGNKIQIDRPLDWEENGDSFRIFYRDSNDRWCFFYSGEPSTGPFSISLDMPGRLFYLQRRISKRVPVPVGTRAMVKRDVSHLMKTVYLMDISEAGMLFCDGASEVGYPVGSFINDIVVSLPPQPLNGSTIDSGLRKVLPLIHKGRVVRTFVDKQTGRNCCGVEFSHGSSYVKDTLRRKISNISAS